MHKLGGAFKGNYVKMGENFVKRRKFSDKNLNSDKNFKKINSGGTLVFFYFNFGMLQNFLIFA